MKGPGGSPSRGGLQALRLQVGGGHLTHGTRGHTLTTSKEEMLLQGRRGAPRLAATAASPGMLGDRALAFPKPPGEGA